MDQNKKENKKGYNPPPKYEFDLNIEKKKPLHDYYSRELDNIKYVIIKDKSQCWGSLKANGKKILLREENYFLYLNENRNSKKVDLYVIPNSKINKYFYDRNYVPIGIINKEEYNLSNKKTIKLSSNNEISLEFLENTKLVYKRIEISSNLQPSQDISNKNENIINTRNLVEKSGKSGDFLTLKENKISENEIDNNEKNVISQNTKKHHLLSLRVFDQVKPKRIINMIVFILEREIKMEDCDIKNQKTFVEICFPTNSPLEDKEILSKYLTHNVQKKEGKKTSVREVKITYKVIEKGGNKEQSSTNERVESIKKVCISVVSSKPNRALNYLRSLEEFDSNRKGKKEHETFVFFNTMPDALVDIFYNPEDTKRKNHPYLLGSEIKFTFSNTVCSKCKCKGHWSSSCTSYIQEKVVENGPQLHCKHVTKQNILEKIKTNHSFHHCNKNK